MTQEEMNVLIPAKLMEIEKDFDVTILWAVESGSRAWGFASPDSDFDVRFIYKRNQDAYLKLNPDKDVIEFPIDDTWDVSGWDLDKTLKLLQKSNPTLYEWIQSPIKYYGTDFDKRFEPLMNACFSEEKMLYHYLNTAKHNIKDFLLGDKVRPKKYFYALRPILACIWVRKFHTAPPVLFMDLYNSVLPSELKESVDHLLDLKMNGPEKMEIPRMEDISGFLDEQMKDVATYLNSLKIPEKDTWDDLNRFFIEEINR